MNSFTNDTKGYEEYLAYKAFKTFFDSYLIDRDYEKTISYIDEDFLSFGIGREEVAVDKSEFIDLLRAELKVFVQSLGYNVKNIAGKEIAKNCWIILANVDIIITVNSKNIIYETRFTGSFVLTENSFNITSMHISEASKSVEERELLTVNYLSGKDLIDKSKAEEIVFDIMSKSMPGGIISGYAEDGFPLCFINDKYLEMLGYTSYDEYYKDADGLGMTHIHPDDRDMVNKEVMNSYSTDTQYGIEYRIKHKKGHYIHVYDIGKKMLTPDNKEVIVCVVYDMTEDAKLKEILFKESNYDALTGLFNRGGGIRTIEHDLESVDAYSFAFFDIDNLKLINDVYSHTAGDESLKYFAAQLTKNFEEGTVLARVGGDEFVAFFRERFSVELIESTFKELEQKYCEYIEENYPKSHSSVSIGCITGTKKYSFDILYQTADKLMYEIKKSGKKGYKIVELE
ncbi:MAG: diguanylate cyclase [Lachnospiraceae bacterium]|nr:diguanylate cyclase [Lachnospiraceae bacterium]